MRRTQTRLPGIPRMMAGRLVASLAAEFPRMSSILEAGVRPEARGLDSPASGPDSLRSSLCCRGQLRRWVGRGRSSRAGARDLGSQCCRLGDRRRSRRSARVSGVMRTSGGAGPRTGGIGGVTLAWRRAASSCNKESWLEKYQEIKNNWGKQQ